jgi:hypothetical protein
MQWRGSAAVVWKKMLKEAEVKPSCIIYSVTHFDVTPDEIDEIIIEKRIVSIVDAVVYMIRRIDVYKIHFLVRQWREYIVQCSVTIAETIFGRAQMQGKIREKFFGECMQNTVVVIL